MSSSTRRDAGGDTALDERTAVRKPPRFKVIMHNDDYTVRDWVVYVIEEYFHKPHDVAVTLMLTIHHTGSAIVGVYPWEIAESKAEEVNEASREAGYPLLCTCEPE